MPKSCLSCTHYWEADSIPNNIMNGSFPLKVCGKLSKTLPSDNERLSAIGKDCSSYTQENKLFNRVKDEKPFRGVIGFSAGAPEEDTGKYGHGDSGSCHACHFYSPQEEMYDKTGVSFPYCHKYAEFIPVGEEPFIPKRLACRTVSSNNLKHFDRIWEFVNIGEVMTTAVKENVMFKPPEIVKSKVTVSDADKAAGVEEWFTVKSPDGKRSINLPRFRADYFSDIERSKIPKSGDEEHPELYIDHLNLTYRVGAIWLGLDKTPALTGIAGSGKTEFFRHMAYIMGLPFERVSIHKSLEVDDLAGKMLYSKEIGTHFQYGRIPQAWSKPCVILIDEPNTGKNDVWQWLRPLTDNSKQLVLDNNEGERIEKNRFCFMGMAMNPAWDARNVGTNDISDADGRRLYHVAVPSPNATVETKIIKNACKIIDFDIDDSDIKMILAISMNLRRLASEDVLPMQWGISQNVKVAQSLKYFDMVDAYRLAAADMLEPDISMQVIQTVRSFV